MKNIIFVSAVLLICVSTSFSNTAFLNCALRAHVQRVQDLYAVVKNERPQYQAVIDDFAKRDTFDSTEYAVLLHVLETFVNASGNRFAVREALLNLEKNLDLCQQQYAP